jgi:hypothetical protein
MLFKDLIRGSSTLASTPALVSALLRLAAQLSWHEAVADETLLAMGVEVMSVLEAAADSGHICGPEPLLDADLAVTLACNILSAFGKAQGQRRSWSTVNCFAVTLFVA